MPVGSEQRLMMGAAGGAGGNYFGDGSDGALSTSGDVTYTVLNKVGSFDGDMLVKNFTSMTIADTHTVTVDQGCRGFLCYVDGDVSITGTLSMKGKGGHCDPTTSGGSDSAAVNANGIQLGMFTASGTDTLAAHTFAGCGNAAIAAVANQPAIAGDGTKFSMIKLGAAGGGGASCNPPNGGCGGGTGTAGTTGAVAISTAGGGGGGAWEDDGSGPASGGAGGRGGAFSGGAGGGSRFNSGGPAASGGDYGGAGGGNSGGGNQGGGHGGAGNPGGAGGGNGPSYGGTGGRPGQTGCGGILWLIVSGNVTVNSGGLITAGGMDGGKGSAHRTPGGGGSGGGSIMILQAGTYTNNGTVEAPGGTVNTYGGPGGVGGIYNTQVSE